MVQLLSCVCLSWPHELQPARLLCPWDSPGKNTGVGCHLILQGIVLTQGLNLCLLHCRQILYSWATEGQMPTDTNLSVGGMNTFNIGFQIGSIYHYFGRRLNFKIAPQPCCLFQRRASNCTNCIHYLMSHILKKQGEPIISTCVHRRTHETSQMISSDLPTLDLRALTDRVLATTLNSEWLTWRSLWSFLFSKLGFFMINSFRTLKGSKKKNKQDILV